MSTPAEIADRYIPRDDAGGGAGANRLPVLAREINAAMREEQAQERTAETARKAAMEAKIRVAELLIEAKALVPHGQWLTWLADNCAMSVRTAQMYMRVVGMRGEIEAAKSETVSDLGLRASLRSVVRPRVIPPGDVEDAEVVPPPPAPPKSHVDTAMGILLDMVNPHEQARAHQRLDSGESVSTVMADLSRMAGTPGPAADLRMTAAQREAYETLQRGDEPFAELFRAAEDIAWRLGVYRELIDTHPELRDRLRPYGRKLPDLAANVAAISEFLRAANKTEAA